MSEVAEKSHHDKPQKTQAPGSSTPEPSPEDQAAQYSSSDNISKGGSGSPIDPKSITPGMILRLQSTIGNRAVQRLLGRSTIQRAAIDATQSSLSPQAAEGMSREEIEMAVQSVREKLLTTPEDDPTYTALQSNLNILETAAVQQDYEAARDQMLDSDQEYFDPSSPVFAQYAQSVETLQSLGSPPQDELQGLMMEADQLIVMDQGGQVQLLNDQGFVQIEDNLFPYLDNIAEASRGGSLDITQNQMDQVLVWEDGRAVITPAISGDMLTLLQQGQPAQVEAAVGVPNLEKPWESVRDAGMHSAMTSGIYQLGTYPISRFNGVNLNPGTRIRFADPRFPMKSQTRMLTLFEPGTKRYFAWDYHLPAGKKPHPLWHINQKGMSGLFGQTEHAAMTASQIRQAKSLRYLKVGGKAFIIVGVFVDSYTLTSSVIKSIEQGSPNPAVAETIRVVGGWGAAWAGAKVGAAGGALLGIETGPGAALSAIAGGIVGGFAGYFGADWIADMIDEN